ncbi:MAG: sigma70-ECF: polymerase sigma factor, sigma-70 family [Firmicutes bacterium]|nr:sigma70-ECF: polymerase sigma factor, sigma-70 family [Bacillota bacterium]
MKMKYEFLTGEIIEIEVLDNIGEVAIGIDRDMYNSNRRETRRHNSIDFLAEQGMQIADSSSQVAANVEARETEEVLHKVIAMLLPQQQKLVRQIFFNERSMAEIASEEGVTAKAIQYRVNKIKARLRKIIEKNLD